MNSVIDILKQSRIFGSLDNARLTRIASLMEQRRIEEGEVLADAGDNAVHFFILVSGALLNSMEGGKSFVAGTPGDFIGLETLVSQGRYTSTLTALSQGEILVIKRAAFLEMIREDADAAAQIMNAWGSYLSEAVPFIEPAASLDNHY